MSGLLIVSDIYGFPENCPVSLATAQRRVAYHRLSTLAEEPALSGEALHEHLFGREGIGIAIRALVRSSHDDFCGLGFSAGGTVLWKAVAGGLRLRALVCVSSTRLRYESAPLPIPTLTLWGENDPRRPDWEWGQQTSLETKSYAGKHHDFYRSDLTSPRSSLSEDIERFLSRFEGPIGGEDAAG